MLTDKDIGYLLATRNQIQVWHWQTQGFSQHQALGDLYSALGDLTDSLVEKDGRGRSIPTPRLETQLVEYRFGAPEELLTGPFKRFLADIDQRMTSEPGLLNITADMRNAVDQALYLLSLR